VYRLRAIRSEYSSGRVQLRPVAAGSRVLLRRSACSMSEGRGVAGTGFP
jgi:hypothetical protein